MLENKKGIAADRAKKGYLSGMMVFEFFSPNMPSIASSAGVDFLMYDMEHTAIGTDILRQQMAACRGLDLCPLVRVPSVEANIIGQVLDIGAHGIMVPMVETAAQAADIVRRAYYPPVGKRGTAFSIAHDAYQAGEPVQKMKEANDKIMVIAMIETEDGLRNVDEIAATPGIDVLWLGHFDLTSSLGIAGQLDHPVYIEAVGKISRAAAAHGKFAGYMAADKAFASHYWAEGYRMLAYGLDHLLLMSALSDGLAHIRQLAEER
jgi:2-keto-3-deoxy-L-rhamnonate aldolase RhmA